MRPPCWCPSLGYQYGWRPSKSVQKKAANEILFPPQRLKGVFRTERFRLKSECRDGAFGLRAYTHFAQRKSNNAPPVNPTKPLRGGERMKLTFLVSHETYGDEIFTLL